MPLKNRRFFGCPEASWIEKTAAHIPHEHAGKAKLYSRPEWAKTANRYAFLITKAIWHQNGGSTFNFPRSAKRKRMQERHQRKAFRPSSPCFGCYQRVVQTFCSLGRLQALHACPDHGPTILLFPQTSLGRLAPTLRVLT